MAGQAPMKARILYWGVEGAGTTTNLELIHSKLRADRRGRISRVPTRVDSTVCYETLPIELGAIGGITTQIEIATVPAGPEQAPTRMQLLDEVGGIALVLDARPERLQDNLDCVAELRRALAAYGRAFDELPVVLQLNHRDQCDDDACARLREALGLAELDAFEAVAMEGRGVLETLTTLSKRVVRRLRDARSESGPPTPNPGDTIAVPPPPESGHAQAAAGDAPVEAHERRADDVAEQPAPAAEPAPPAERPGDGAAPRPTLLLEEAMASEAESEADDALELEAHAAFDRSYHSVADEMAQAKPATSLAIGPELRIVSVGSASRQGERSVRVPLVLGDASGATATIALSVSLEPLLDESD